MSVGRITGSPDSMAATAAATSSAVTPAVDHPLDAREIARGRHVAVALPAENVRDLARLAVTDLELSAGVEGWSLVEVGKPRAIGRRPSARSIPCPAASTTTAVQSVAAWLPPLYTVPLVTKTDTGKLLQSNFVLPRKCGDHNSMTITASRAELR